MLRIVSWQVDWTRSYKPIQLVLWRISMLTATVYIRLNSLLHYRSRTLAFLHESETLIPIKSCKLVLLCSWGVSVWSSAGHGAYEALDVMMPVWFKLSKAFSFGYLPLHDKSWSSIQTCFLHSHLTCQAGKLNETRPHSSGQRWTLSDSSPTQQRLIH